MGRGGSKPRKPKNRHQAPVHGRAVVMTSAGLVTGAALLDATVA